MSKSPILAIDEIAQNQANKHITHNDAVAALEAAMNDILEKDSIGAGPVNLSETEATRYAVYRLKGASANFNFVMPSTINGNNAKRVFSVRNETSYTVTVKASTGSGSTVAINAGRATVLLQNHEDIAPLFSFGSIDFLELGGTPNSYSGQKGKILAVKEEEDGLEFIDPPEGGGGSGAESFIDLDDVPADYTGQGGKFLAVKESEDGVEFVDPPSGGGGGDNLIPFGAISTGFPFVGSVSTAPCATKGNTVRAYMDCRLGAISVSLAPELEDEKYKVVIAKMIGQTIEIDDIVAESAEWTSPGAGTYRVLFDFQTPVEIEKGTDYSFLIVRTDASESDSCNILFPDQAPAAQPIGFTFVRAVREEDFPEAELLLDDYGSTTDYVAMDLYLYLDDIGGLVFYPSLTGNAKKFLAVNEEEDGVEWVDGGSASFPDLVGNAGKVLAVNQTEDGVEWIDPPSGGGEQEEGYQYWKFINHDVGGTICIRRIQFRDESGVSQTRPFTGVTTYSAGGTWYNPEYVLYDNIDYSRLENRADGDTLVINFGEPINPKFFWLQTDNTPDTITSYEIQRSKDGANWETVLLTTGLNIGSNQTREDPLIPPAPALTEDAPSDGKLYGRKDGAWEEVPTVVPVGLNEQTSNYTLALSDAGKLVRMDVASANDLTVPANSSVAFPVGTVIMVRQAGTGQTTIVADTGVTINTPETLKLRKQHSGATLIKVDDDEWDLVGDLELASS